MSSRTYICLPCRWARRAPAFGQMAPPRCPLCREDLWRLDRRWRVPTRDDLQGWKRLVAAIARDAGPPPRRVPAADAKLSGIERQLANALAQPESARLLARLRRLRQKRRLLLRQRRTA